MRLNPDNYDIAGIGDSKPRQGSTSLMAEQIREALF